MAKISIITFHFSNNTGAMLQAYGLSQAVLKMGHEVQVIDYRPLSIRKACEPPLPKHPMRFYRSLKYRYSNRKFRKNFLPLTRVYLDIDELRRDPPISDCTICGSDQVWNINSAVRGFDSSYFLDFIDGNDSKKISYAASFGNGKDLGQNKSKVINLLSQFKEISVRDVTSAHLINSFLSRKATQVLDPSFLTDYDSITPPSIIKGPYILAYCFRKTKISELALKLLQEKYSIPIISIKTHFDRARVIKPNPLEWLSLMKHANFICTDSFHGTCFSLKNQKQFLTTPYEGGESRLVDILHKMKISNRFVENETNLRYEVNNSIDYKLVNIEIKEAISVSLAFLRNAINT